MSIENKEENMDTLRGKHIAILAEDQYEDLELWYPKLRFSEAGARVTVIGPEKKTYQSKHEYPVQADQSIHEVKADEFDAVVIPGGYAPDRMRQTPAMVDFVRQMAVQKKGVAAICHAGSMLVSADLVGGKRVTSWKSIRDDLVHAGGRFEDAPVVRDENIITSRMPQDLPAFCRTVIEFLSNKS
jgi:protease I